MSCFWILLCLTSGCGLNSAVLQPGGNGCQGVLINLSSGACPHTMIDPSKPTVLLTHGWNPLPNAIHATFGESSARSIRSRFGDQVNILSWDWNAVRISALRDQPFEIASAQGRQLAKALRCRGVQVENTHLVGHSLGTIVIAQAACCLSDLGTVAQITLLDPPSSFHERIFGELNVTNHGRIIENYWAPGISGYGEPVNCAGVRNYQVGGEHPILGIVDLSVSNHVNVMAWYDQTVRCPNLKTGFQRSFVLDVKRETRL